MFRWLDWLLGDTWYETYLRMYGFLAISHLLFEYGLSVTYVRRAVARFKKAVAEEKAGEKEEPNVPIAAFVPAYQEDLGALRWCLEGLANQLYEAPLVAIVVDDGSYLKEIARYEALVASDAPPTVTISWWHWIALKVPILKRWKRLKLVVKTNQQVLDELRERRRQSHALCEEYVRRYPRRFVFIAAEQNRGKRAAHKLAHDWVLQHFDEWVRLHHMAWLIKVRHVRRKVIRAFGYLTVDSDTWIDPLATTNMVRKMIDERLGACTGYVDIRNAKVNVLTRMVDWRYWSAFFVERGAQSMFGTVMCCSGPLALYRASLMDDPKLRLMEQYITQTFMNQVCTFGDDRKMTALILQAGYKVKFVPEAHCLTYAPESWKDYGKQQTRWNMSFYRELIFALREFWLWHPYALYEMLMQLLLPFMLMGSIGITLWLAAATHNWYMVSQYALVIVLIGLLRSVYGAYERREWSYLLFSFYGFVYLWLLFYVRPRAVKRLLWTNDTGWQTRAVT